MDANPEARVRVLWHLENSRTCEKLGLPTLSQGAVSTRENPLPFDAAWTERAVPIFRPVRSDPQRFHSRRCPTSTHQTGVPVKMCATHAAKAEIPNRTPTVREGIIRALSIIK
jgi:hypothetical protein